MPVAYRLVPFLFFFSGCSSLILQVAWTKRMILTFGATATGVATVLTAFMGGLALGSYLFGRLGSRLKQPVRLYGALELIIGLYALALPWIFDGVTALFVAIVSGNDLSFFTQSLVRFLLSGSVLLIPTTLMGGTLPILSSYYIRNQESFGHSLSVLYSANTIGAVAGTLSSGFILLETFGNMGTSAIAAGINILIFGAALVVTRAPEPEASEVEKEEDEEQEEKAGEEAEEPEAEEAPAPERWSTIQRATVAVACLAGFSGLALEVLWTRSLVLTMGTSTYAFTTILTAFLIGIAVGSWALRKWVDDLKHPVLTLASIQIGILFLSILVLPAFEYLPALVEKLRFLHGKEWLPLTICRFGIAFVMLIGPTFLMGAAFPLAASILSSSEDRKAEDVGIIYSINTVGAIAGSFAGGFLVIPLLGIQTGIVAVVLLNAIAAGLLLLLDPARDGRRVALVVLTGLFWILGMTSMRTWDPTAHAGRMTSQLALDVNRKGTVPRIPREIESLYFKEGTHATILVLEDLLAEIKALKIDGKAVASSNYHDMRVQKMLGHLPVFLCPDPEEAVVVGLGTGMTFGALALHENLETVCVELEEAVIGAAREFAEQNSHAVADRPNTRIAIDDGRNYILTLDHPVDIITMDPIHPWVAGAASLFSREHFQVCLEKLNPNGIMCLWAPLYQLRTRDYKTMVRTFARVFPHAQLWYTNTDGILVGSPSPIRLDPDRFRTVLGKPGVKADLNQVSLGRLDAILACFWTTRKGILSFSEGAPINHDDLPILEYTAPRSRFKGTIDDNLKALVPYREPVFPHVTGLSADVRKRIEDLYRAEASAIQGKIHYYALRHKEARAAFEKAVSIVPDHGDYNWLLGDTCNELGLRLARAGEMEEAVGVFEQAAHHLPDALRVHYNLSVAYHQTKQFEKEHTENAWVVDKQPRLAVGQLAYANSLFRKKKYEEALKHYDRALKLRPNLLTEKVLRKIQFAAAAIRKAEKEGS